jgi:hypothetical protein
MYLTQTPVARLASRPSLGRHFDMSLICEERARSGTPESRVALAKKHQSLVADAGLIHSVPLGAELPAGKGEESVETGVLSISQSVALSSPVGTVLYVLYSPRTDFLRIT